MEKLEKVSSNDKYRQPPLKKRYVIMFLIAFIVLVCGFLVLSIMSFIPRSSYGDPGYDDYLNLMLLKVLFPNI